MKAHIERVFVIAGNAHCYQYIIVMISMLLWGFTTIFSCSLAFLEAQPTVILYPSTPQQYNTTLTYAICEDDSIPKIILQDKISISWTNELRIECEKLKTSLIGTMASFGYLLGAAFSSIVNNYLGERKTLLSVMLIYILVMTGSIFLKNYYYYCFTAFAACFCSNIGAYTGMVLLNEIIDQKKKAILSIFIYTGVGIGGITFFGLFYYLNNWRHVFYFSIAVTVLIEILILFLLIDSPLKAVNNNDFVTFISLMRFVARVNGKLKKFDTHVGTEKCLLSFKRIFGEENTDEYSEIINSFVNTSVARSALGDSLIDNVNKNYLLNKRLTMTTRYNETIKEAKKESVFLCLFKYKSVRTPFLLFCFFWFSTSCLSSALAISLKFVKGDITIIGVSLYSVEIFGYIISCLLINTQTFGRKGSLMLFSGGISLSLGLYIAFFDHQFYSLVFYIITRFFVMSAFCIYYNFALESYPNSIKTTAYALNGSCNSLGGMVVPFLIEYIERYFLFVGFCALFCVMTLMMTCLKETMGRIPRDEILEIDSNHYDSQKEIFALKYDFSDILELDIE